jgi:hypothetical protein
MPNVRIKYFETESGDAHTVDTRLNGIDIQSIAKAIGIDLHTLQDDTTYLQQISDKHAFMLSTFDGLFSEVVYTGVVYTRFWHSGDQS